MAEAVGQAFALDLPWPDPSDGSTTPQVPPLTRHLSSKACTRTPLMALMCNYASEAVGSAFALDLPWPGPSDGSTIPQVPPLTRHPSVQACTKTPLMALLCKDACDASEAEGQTFAVDKPWPEPSHTPGGPPLISMPGGYSGQITLFTILLSIVVILTDPVRGPVGLVYCRASG